MKVTLIQLVGFIVITALGTYFTPQVFYSEAEEKAFCKQYLQDTKYPHKVKERLPILGNGKQW